MEELTNLAQWHLKVGELTMTFNSQTLYMTWIVMGIMLLFALLATRKMSFVPNPLQLVGELMVGAFKDLADDALEEKGKTYFPMILTLFMFLVLSNWLGIIPFLSEPSRDLNTPLSLGILGFAIAHYVGIRTKGIGAYLKAYAEPIFFMAPLNIIGEIAKVVSISFRLYGNIMGGSIIILVVSDLVYHLILPPFLYGFFGLFVGTIQAFVFTMLTLVYISVQMK